MLGHILTSSCKYCPAVQRGVKKRAAALERPAKEAMATTVKDAGTMTEAAPNAEEAGKIATIRAEEARLKIKEQDAPVKAVKGAEETAEVARKAAGKAEEKKAEKFAVI